MALSSRMRVAKRDYFQSLFRSLPGPSEPDPRVSSVEFLGLDFAWRKSCGSPPNYPRTTGCIRCSTHTYMSVHVHAHRRKGEATWHDWVVALWTRFGHTCCSEAPPPRRTCAAVCTCRARRRIKSSARRRPGASLRSSRTCTRMTTIDPRPGTSIPPTASSCGAGRSSTSAAAIVRAFRSARGAGGPERHEGVLLPGRLVGLSDSPGRAVRPSRGREGGGQGAERPHGHGDRDGRRDR